MPSFAPRSNLPRPSTRRRLGRRWRALVCALLVAVLFPGSYEVFESLVHLAHDGHLPHSEQHDALATTEDCGESSEHGCSAMSHHCACCVSASAVPSTAPTTSPVWLAALNVGVRAPTPRGPPRDGVKPILPPPIA